MPNEVQFADLRVKHLEMIQGIIARMASYSASLKSFCLTVVAAIGSAIVTLRDLRLLWFALLVIVVFACLDARYLQLERRFRGLFDKVRGENWQTMPDFDVGLASAPAERFFGSLFNWSILLFYGLILGGVALIVLYSRS